MTSDPGRPLAWRPPVATLPGARVGIVPLLFANDDMPDLTEPIGADGMLDQIARLGYEGTQLSRVLPRGAQLKEALAARSLRVAEVYAALPCDQDGPPPQALVLGREKIRDA